MHLTSNNYNRGAVGVESGHYIYNNKEYLVILNTYDEPDEAGNYIEIDDYLGKAPIFLSDETKQAYKYLKENAAMLYENAMDLIIDPVLSNYVRKSLFFIEEEGVLKSVAAEDIDKPVLLIERTKKYNKLYCEAAKKYIGKDCCTLKIFLQRILKLDESFSFLQALEYLKANPEMFKVSYLPGYIKDDPIISFGKPNITRKTGNKDKNTFDFVSVEILLRSDLEIKDIAAFTKEHLEDFDRRAREHIDNAKTYQKYGVPIDFLTLYGCATRGRSCLEFKYELKEVWQNIYNLMFVLSFASIKTEHI